VQEDESVPLEKLIALIFALFTAGAAFAEQAGTPAPAPPAVNCPPGVNGDPPTIGGGRSTESLSEKLAESKGIICPPAGIDPEMQKAPPTGGAIRIIPPPGTPGGDPTVQPK
jgi:hypothetical protein